MSEKEWQDLRAKVDNTNPDTEDYLVKRNEKKLDRKQRKKKIKKSVQDSCQTQ
jgi:hypothetical protein